MTRKFPKGRTLPGPVCYLALNSLQDLGWCQVCSEQSFTVLEASHIPALKGV